MNGSKDLPRVPEILVPKLEELEEGRGAWLDGSSGEHKAASRALGPPVLMGDMTVGEAEASELNLLFHRYKGRPVHKAAGWARPALILSPRILRWQGTDCVYVELAILGVL
ncbi:MAG TPA: hypothetical protein VKA48_03865 [Gammaproteobacteria bacterium]|nr:hypothetical protein [Gammaproteobacteria bacterium]